MEQGAGGGPARSHRLARSHYRSQNQFGDQPGPANGRDRVRSARADVLLIPGVAFAITQSSLGAIVVGVLIALSPAVLFAYAAWEKPSGYR